MTLSITPGNTFLLLATLLCLSLASRAHASGSILIWPIDPVIEHDERATALWLENRGVAPAQMQLRVFAWHQIDGENLYESRSGVIGSPPMIRIEPGERQLIRLTRTVEVAPGTERSFRVIVDEIPTPGEQDNGDQASTGIRFQMRYSIPLFVQGEGLWTKERHDRRRTPGSVTQPALSWRTALHDGTPYVEIHNAGQVHARLTGAAFRQGEAITTINDGLLGYVLPGSTMRWPLPDGIHPHGELVATVNAGTSPQVITPAP